MTDEEINIAIAEACGWKRPDSPDAMKLKQGWTMPEKWWLCPKGVLRFKHDMPNYCNDLNECHKFEMSLDDAKHDSFQQHLLKIVSPKTHWSDMANTRIVSATARQRAEALLKTLNLTKESE